MIDSIPEKKKQFLAKQMKEQYPKEVNIYQESIDNDRMLVELAKA